MHWYCAGLGRPGTAMMVLTHWPDPRGSILVKPSTAAHAGFGTHVATAQSSEPHVAVVTVVPCAPHTSAMARGGD